MACIEALSELASFEKTYFRAPLIAELHRNIEDFKRSYPDVPLFDPKTQPNAGYSVAEQPIFWNKLPSSNIIVINKVLPQNLR